MSYYSSKHPGLFIYMILVSITVTSFLFFDLGSFYIGILSVIWGLYTAMRALSLYEMSEHYEAYASMQDVSKNHNGQTSSLAYDLMNRINRGQNMKRGMLALYCLHERTILWFMLALLYTAYHLHTASGIETKATLMETMCTMFMIGATFWAGQSYAHSKHVARALSGLFGVLFLMSLFKLRASLNIDALEGGIAQSGLLQFGKPEMLLLILMLYSVAILLFALVEQKNSPANIFIGLALVSIMAACHILLIPSTATTALWLSGWGLFSVFWVRSYGTQQKRYVLYQCE